MPIIVDPPAEADPSPAQEITEYLIALLGVAGVEAYTIDKLKELQARGDGAFPNDYAEFHLSTRGRGGVRRSDGTSGVLGYRVQIRVVCRYVDNADLLIHRTRGALYGAHVPVGGLLSTPIDEGPSDPPRPDDGWYSAMTEWTFTL